MGRVRVARDDNQPAAAGALPRDRRRVRVDDLAFLDVRGDEVAGRSRNDGDRVPAWPTCEVFDDETSYGGPIAERQHIADESRRGPQKRSSGRLEPGRQPRFVEAHDALSDEGRLIRYGQCLAQVVIPGPNENLLSLVAGREGCNQAG